MVYCAAYRETNYKTQSFPKCDILCFKTQGSNRVTKKPPRMNTRSTEKKHTENIEGNGEGTPRHCLSHQSCCARRGDNPNC